jgi:hypothetical protein
MKSLLRCGPVVLSAGLGVFRAIAAPAAPAVPFSHPLANVELAPELRTAAEREHIDLSRRTVPGGEASPGDWVLLWVGARHDGRSEQWLVQLTRRQPTRDEQAAHRGKELKKYLSWGPVVTFHSEVEALDVWIAGPVDVSAPSASRATAVPIGRTRVLVPGDYLRLGLDDSERVDLHIRRRTAEILKQDPTFNLGQIYALDEPVKPQNVAYARAVADRIVFTPELERAWVGGYVALQAFYEIVNDTPPLRAIASLAVRKPAPWKLVKLAFGTSFRTTFGGPDARLIQPERLGLLPVGLESFEVPYRFAFGPDEIVSGWMVVSRPVAPLDVSAGILALIAFHPKDPTRAVELVVLAADRGERPAKPARPAAPPAGDSASPRVALAATVPASGR